MCNPGDSETSRTGKLMASLTICHSTSSGTSGVANGFTRSEEHTSELQSRLHLVCRLLLEKKQDADDLQLGGSDRRHGNTHCSEPGGDDGEVSTERACRESSGRHRAPADDSRPQQQPGVHV